MSREQRFWLMKSEPDTFSFDDLLKAPNQTTVWDGVRNYQARNFLRDDFAVGDRVLFYHSSTAEPGVIGTAKVVKAGFPDPSALNPKSPYYDPQVTAEKPRWYVVEVRAERAFTCPVTLAAIRERSDLKDMLVLKKGMRLSVQPVSKQHFAIIERLGC